MPRSMLTHRAVSEESFEVYFNSNYSMIFISEISFENKYFTDCMACVLGQYISLPIPKVPLPARGDPGLQIPYGVSGRLTV